MVEDLLVVAPPAADLRDCWGGGSDERSGGWADGGREGAAGLGWRGGEDSPEHCDDCVIDY